MGVEGGGSKLGEETEGSGWGNRKAGKKGEERGKSKNKGTGGAGGAGGLRGWRAGSGAVGSHTKTRPAPPLSECSGECNPQNAMLQKAPVG